MKFKAWDYKEKEWVKDIMIAGEDGLLLMSSVAHYKNPSQVVMYSGEKDKKDVEIYDGWIVKSWDNLIYQVVFMEGCFMLYRQIGTEPNHFSYESLYEYINRTMWQGPSVSNKEDIDKCLEKNLEIIGNIFENPEMRQYPEKDVR